MKIDIFTPFINKNTNKKKYIRKNIIGVNKESYFDYTASGLAFKEIEKRIKTVLKTYSNTHSEYSSNSIITNEYYEEAKTNIARHLNLNEQFTVLPVAQGATGAIKYLQEILGVYIPPVTKERLDINIEKTKLPLVIVGPYEHHSNELSFREALCEVVRIELDKNGLVDLKQLEMLLKSNSKRQIIASFSIASNVTGIISPYKKISKLLRRYNAIVCFDAAASAPYINIESKYYDALVCSPHKLLGGVASCGLLVIKKDLIRKDLAPTFSGGGTVKYVNKKVHYYKNDINQREEAGTPPIIQMIRACLAFQLRNEIGFDYIRRRKQNLIEYLLKELKKSKNITIYGNYKKKNIGIVSINIKNQTPFEICSKISKKYKIQTRAGCSCAGPYGHDILNIKEIKNLKDKPGWLRISIHFSHKKRDLIDLLNEIKKFA